MDNPPTNHQEIVDFYNKWSKKKITLTSDREQAITKALKKYDYDRIRKAIIGCIKFEHNVALKYKTLEYILRLSTKNDNIKRFSAQYKYETKEDQVKKKDVKRESLNVKYKPIEYQEDNLDERCEHLINFFDEWFYCEHHPALKETVIKELKDVLKIYNYKTIKLAIRSYYYNLGMAQIEKNNFSMSQCIKVVVKDGRIVLDNVLYYCQKFKPKMLRPPTYLLIEELNKLRGIQNG